MRFTSIVSTAVLAFALSANAAPLVARTPSKVNKPAALNVLDGNTVGSYDGDNDNNGDDNVVGSFDGDLDGDGNKDNFDKISPIWRRSKGPSKSKTSSVNVLDGNTVGSYDGDDDNNNDGNVVGSFDGDGDLDGNKDNFDTTVHWKRASSPNSARTQANKASKINVGDDNTVGSYDGDGDGNDDGNIVDSGDFDLDGDFNTGNFDKTYKSWGKRSGKWKPSSTPSTPSSVNVLDGNTVLSHDLDGDGNNDGNIEASGDGDFDGDDNSGNFDFKVSA